MLCQSAKLEIERIARRGQLPGNEEPDEPAGKLKRQFPFIGLAQAITLRT
jgi:hypothetical protein